MRNISFMLTTEQIRARTKTVTRRLGWRTLKPGDLLQGVVKGMGLKPGEKVQKLAVICVVSVRREPLRMILDDLDYGFDEVVREGFEGHPHFGWPSQFVEFFCNSHRGCIPATVVTRIEFEYIDETASGLQEPA